jgi:hypothetical protein
MSKHTPGPWAVYELLDGYDIRAPEAECYIATASDPEAVWGAIGREEDACLIAAAPELLEALELALDSHNRLLLSDPPKDAWVFNGVEAKARVAIAKAKGEE